VGYFDEGIYGNYGWGGGEAPEPLGQPGLVRFDQDFDITWALPFSDEIPTRDSITALNVIGEAAWTSYYSDYPLVRAEPEATRSWNTGIDRIWALLLCGDAVGLVAPVNEQVTLLTGNLEDTSVSVRQQRSLLTTDGGDVSQLSLFGRADQLHAFGNGYWYRGSFD
jgi:hypothetical protein